MLGADGVSQRGVVNVVPRPSSAPMMALRRLWTLLVGDDKGVAESGDGAMSLARKNPADDGGATKWCSC